MFSRPKILFLVSLLFVALLNPKFNPYLLFKFLIFYHSSIYIYIYSINLLTLTEGLLLALYKKHAQVSNNAKETS